jgi:hypothetical protein
MDIIAKLVCSLGIISLAFGTVFMIFTVFSILNEYVWVAPRFHQAWWLYPENAHMRDALMIFIVNLLLIILGFLLLIYNKKRELRVS